MGQTRLTPQNAHFMQFRIAQIRKTLKIVEALQQLIDFTAWNDLQPPEDRMELEDLQRAWCEANRILGQEVLGDFREVDFSKLVALLTN